MISPNLALGWLLEHGYFSKDSDGWCSPVKPPTEADLAHYVRCTLELGRQSVAMGTSKPAVWIRIDGLSKVIQFKSSSKP